MFPRLTGAVFAVACSMASGLAYAAAYDDFAAGIAAYERGDGAGAIASLTAAINASDLAPNLKVTAYLDRGNAYVVNHQCALALADANAAKALGSNGNTLLVLLANAELCSGNFKDADASFTALLASMQGNSAIYFARGRERWASGDFAGAASDFTALNAARPDYPYSVLWLAVAEYRAGHPDLGALEKAASRFDNGTWPAPIVKFYLAQAKAEDVEAAAAQGDQKAISGQQCEANFYVAEWRIAQNDSSAAKPLLQAAMDKCPPTFIERGAATIEIARLK